MSTTVQELDVRLTLLEQKVAMLQHLTPRSAEGESAAMRGARLLHRASANQAAIAAVWSGALAELAITGKPVGAEKVQEMMAACGIRPEENEFSRGIIELREE
jgi:hypothetical protein